MARRSGIVAEAVFLLRDGTGEVDNQMLWGEFKALTSRAVAMDNYAGKTVRAIYAEIGAGLAVRGMTCFHLNFDPDGFVGADWNVPVQDLAANAGSGPHLGSGPVRIACRSQCSIPWVTLRLWDPDLRSETNECMHVQEAVRRNRLGVADADKPRFQRTGRWKVTPPNSGPGARILEQLAGQSEQQPAAGPRPAVVVDQPAPTATRVQEPPLLHERAQPLPDPAAAPSQAERAALKAQDARQVQDNLTDRFDAAFGDARTIPVEKLVQHSSGRIHDLVKQHQIELDRMHQEHMSQLRSHRQEIQRLKAELERERSRNTLLEGFLRGEIKA